MPRGKKTCPECEAEWGPRTKVCECGHEFSFNAPKGKKKAPKTEPATLTEEASIVVGIGDREDLNNFIDQLRAADSSSRQNGGMYSAFLHHKKGVLQVEVQLSVKHVANLRRLG